MLIGAHFLSRKCALFLCDSLLRESYITANAVCNIIFRKENIMRANTRISFIKKRGSRRMKAPWSRVCISEISCVLLFLFVFRRKHGCAVRAFRRADLHVIHQAVWAGFRGRSRLFSPQNFRYCCGFRQFFLAEVLLKTVKYAILFYTFPRYT